jgi:hypothetical protein
VHNYADGPEAEGDFDMDQAIPERIAYFFETTALDCLNHGASTR